VAQGSEGNGVAGKEFLTSQRRKEVRLTHLPSAKHPQRNLASESVVKRDQSSLLNEKSRYFKGLKKGEKNRKTARRKEIIIEVKEK